MVQTRPFGILKSKSGMKNYRRRFMNFMLVAFRGLESLKFTERQKTLLEELVDDIKQSNNSPKVNEVHKELSDVVRHLWM